jgi:hypothetical protein
MGFAHDRHSCDLSCTPTCQHLSTSRLGQAPEEITYPTSRSDGLGSQSTLQSVLPLERHRTENIHQSRNPLDLVLLSIFETELVEVDLLLGLNSFNEISDDGGARKQVRLGLRWCSYDHVRG